MEEVKKYVDFGFLLGFVIVAWLSIKLIDGVWRMFGQIPNPELFADISASTAVGMIAAVGLSAYLRLNPRVYTLANECGVELKKTIWPGWSETRSNTIVVIAVTFIMGTFLWFFDLIWTTITGLIYP